MRRRGFLYTLATSPLLAATAAGMMAAHPSVQAVTAADDPLAHHRAKIRVGELTTVIGDNVSDPQVGQRYGMQMRMVYTK